MPNMFSASGEIKDKNKTHKQTIKQTGKVPVTRSRNKNNNTQTNKQTGMVPQCLSHGQRNETKHKTRAQRQTRTDQPKEPKKPSTRLRVFGWSKAGTHPSSQRMFLRRAPNRRTHPHTHTRHTQENNKRNRHTNRKQRVET